MTVGERYELAECLVGSQVTEVWLARDLELGRDVVLKRLLADSAESNRLLAEARALAAFNHPHVVTLYGTVDDWLVMEYVPGGNLDGRPRMSPKKAAHVGAKIAGALAALHDKDLVHLDVKPANIVGGGDGAVKLTDFGAAYRIGGRDTATRNGAISCTFAYAAPEVIKGQPGAKADVFSLGATIYALVAGHPPRQEADGGESDEDSVAWELAHTDVPLTADVGPLRELLQEMLRLDPRARPKMRQVQKRLEKIAGESTAVAGRALIVSGACVALVAVWYGYGLDQDRKVSAPTPPTTSATPAPAPSSKGPASPLIGDHRTADPCAMTDPAALGRFGETELDIDYGNFDRCDVIVSPPGGGAVDVMVDLNHLAPPEQAGELRTVGTITVAGEPRESGECSRTLVLPGVADTTVRVRAQWEDEGKADLCEIADAAATIAARALDRGPLERRSPPLPESSLAQRDACALLSGKALETIPGVDAADPDFAFAGWGCTWGSTTSDTGVDLRFDRGLPPTAEDGTATRINGYRAVIEPAGEGGRTCLVQVVYRSYTDQNGRTAAEKVRLVVSGSRPVDRLCRMATTLADSATDTLRGT
jgi:hypothetical protein